MSITFDLDKGSFRRINTVVVRGRPSRNLRLWSTGAPFVHLTLMKFYVILRIRNE